MKFTRSIALIAGALTVLAASPAMADQTVTYSSPQYTLRTPNMLLFNPGDLIVGIVSLEYERALATWFGLTLGVSILSFRGVFAPERQESYIAILPEFGARFHFIQDAPGGLWVGPYLGAGYVAARSNGGATREFGYGLGGALGYNFIIGPHFVFQLGVGAGFHDLGDGIAFAPRIRLGLGGVF